MELKLNELVKLIKKDNEIYSEKEIKAVLEVAFKTISERLAHGDSIDINGFGKFSVVDVAARNGINPATKERISIPASKKVRFRIAKKLKDRVNE